jgi:hypothetical protein
VFYCASETKIAEHCLGAVHCKLNLGEKTKKPTS